LGRILALDYGRKRTGIAVTDPLRIIATGLDTVSSSEVFEFLTNYTRREKVDTIVVGYPVQMDNSPSEAVHYIDPFVRELRKRFPSLEIILADERFTSKMATRAMIEAGAKKKQRQDKAMIDKISAVIILQSFMEANNRLK
jgi:putative Holliday junction resolvase